MLDKEKKINIIPGAIEITNIVKCGSGIIAPERVYALQQQQKGKDHGSFSTFNDVKGEHRLSFSE